MPSVESAEGVTPLSKELHPVVSGAPRWTAVLGAVVGAVGVLWSIVSYFMSHPLGREPPPRNTPLSISVSEGGIGIGEMHGGQIIYGSRPSSDSSKTTEPKR